MQAAVTDPGFQTINIGYDSVFQPDRMSIGLVVPLEGYRTSPVPTMQRHLERVQLAEELGFSAVWVRDVPFNVLSFGDAGQTFDPFTYLGYLSAGTKRIALGTASIILPLRHPAHVAKAAASVDVLSGGRLILGVASGDRPEEYPALNMPYADRGQRFREAFEYIRQVGSPAGTQTSPSGNIYGVPTPDMDMLPKPSAGKLPLLVTGGSQQDRNWIAENSDGWMVYPQNPTAQAQVMRDWRTRLQMVGTSMKPVMQPLHVDLADNPEAPPSPIHLGFRSGVRHLWDYLKCLEVVGVNHVALNLRFNQADTEATMRRLADEILPGFHG